MLPAQQFAVTDPDVPAVEIENHDPGPASADVLGHRVQVNFLQGNHNEIFHPLGASVIATHVRKALGLKSQTIART